MTFPLKHYDRDLFTYKTEGENAVGESGVTFTIGADGKATTVVVENLNVRGEGTSNAGPPVIETDVRTRRSQESRDN